MGGASDAIEDLVGGVALFVNADAGKEFLSFFQCVQLCLTHFSPLSFFL